MPLYIFLITIFILVENETAKRLDPIVLKDNITLPEYDISKSFKLTEDEYILIGKSKIQSSSNEGHRLIYLSRKPNSNRFNIRYVSQPKGEAYVYNPYFYEFPNGDIYILAEEGYEYMSGIDVFKFSSDHQLKFLGYISVSGLDGNSVIDKLILTQHANEQLITFHGKIAHPVSTDNLIDGESLTFLISKNGLTKK